MEKSKLLKEFVLQNNFVTQKLHYQFTSDGVIVSANAILFNRFTLVGIN